MVCCALKSTFPEGTARSRCPKKASPERLGPALRFGLMGALLAVTSVEAADFRAGRDRMVREQIESRGVTNTQVLAAMRKVPRHEFVPEQWAQAAYEDHPLPIGF